MTDYLKPAIAVVLAVVISLAIAGAYQYPKEQQATATSPAGSSFTSSKTLAQQVTTGTTTTYSQFNNGSNQDVIKNAELELYNGLSTTTSYTIACATSTSASSLNSNTNYILDMTILAAPNSQFGTTTGAGMYMSSSSPGITGALVGGTVSTSSLAVTTRVLPAQTYLDCQVTTGDGTNAFNSGVQGVIGFPYSAQ